MLLTAVRLITVLDNTYCTSSLKNPCSHKPVVTASFVQLKCRKANFVGKLLAGLQETRRKGRKVLRREIVVSVSLKTEFLCISELYISYLKSIYVKW